MVLRILYIIFLNLEKKNLIQLTEIVFSKLKPEKANVKTEN